jgi:hypothetical protein
MQVVWARTKIAPGACKNGLGREREREDVQARAANDARTGGECRHEWEGADIMRVPTSTMCTNASTRRKIGINDFIHDYNLSRLGHLQSFNMSCLGHL